MKSAEDYFPESNLMSALAQQVVEVRRFELLTSSLQSWRSTNGAIPPSDLPFTAFAANSDWVRVAKCGGPEWTRTTDLTLIRRVL